MISLVQRASQRLLDKDMAASLEHLPAERQMEPVWSREDDGLDGVVLEELVERSIARHVVATSDFAREND